LGQWQSAQAVVSAELDNDDLRMKREDGAQIGSSILGGRAACALVRDFVVIAAVVQVALQSVGKRLAGLQSVTGCDAVAIANQQGPVGGQQRADCKNQPKRNDKRAANVHINSVAKSRELGEKDREAQSVIEVRDAKKWIQNGTRRVEILKGISLVIPAGQFVAIVGASGSGKSTLLGLLAGLDTPSSGEIFLDSVPIHNLAETELAEVRGAKIGFVFQSYQLIETLTALENVLLPYELNAEGSGLLRARRLLDEVGLKERVDHYPVQLSGGEQQRVALARAFVVEPPIVMADEPTGNLDSANGKLVLDLLLERNRKAGTTLVMVTHDPEIASRADRKIVLRDGLIVEDTLPCSPQFTHPHETLVHDREKNG
jgi:putative ABC transport system ATP-binding protein